MHLIDPNKPKPAKKPKKPELYYPPIERTGDKILLQMDELEAQRYYVENEDCDPEEEQFCGYPVRLNLECTDTGCYEQP